MMQEPLVSIGMPVYNRPESLKRSLGCILDQTYKNIEIIVSNNSSPNPEVEKTAVDFAKQDKRITYFLQEQNKGPEFNFQFVLKQAHGEYFMWAADDDLYEPFFIEKLVHELIKLGPKYAAATFEAQYMDNNQSYFDFFPEGEAFYDYSSDNPFERIMHILRKNYGNLIYSLYRKNVLDLQNMIFVQNEIPFLLQIAQKGNWRVLPEVGFYKQTTATTYLQACWEIQGGHIPQSSRISPRSLKGFTNYHKFALANIFESINHLTISEKESSTAKSLAKNLIWSHWFNLLIGYKKKSGINK